jgi:hypothetical protein
MPTGESLHVIGREGAGRAKVWLEKTGRVDVNFSRYEVVESPFLTFPKVVGEPFSFDLGGVLRLETGKVSFLGEVKKVSSEGGQGVAYKEYLAKCYRTVAHIGLPYHFMWITWHPFSQNNWTQLCTAAQISSAVTEHKVAYCGPGPVNEVLCAELAERLWLIVLSEKQEGLSMSDSMLGTVKKAVVEGVAP